MSDQKDDGGPAFPSPLEWRETTDDGTVTTGVYDNGHDGMTLRDYFAAKFIEGLWRDPQLEMATKLYTKRAFEFADAMLEARKK